MHLKSSERTVKTTQNPNESTFSRTMRASETNDAPTNRGEQKKKAPTREAIFRWCLCAVNSSACEIQLTYTNSLAALTKPSRSI